VRGSESRNRRERNDQFGNSSLEVNNSRSASCESKNESQRWGGKSGSETRECRSMIGSDIERCLTSSCSSDTRDRVKGSASFEPLAEPLPLYTLIVGLDWASRFVNCTIAIPLPPLFYISISILRCKFSQLSAAVVNYWRSFLSRFRRSGFTFARGLHRRLSRLMRISRDFRSSSTLPRTRRCSCWNASPDRWNRSEFTGTLLNNWMFPRRTADLSFFRRNLVPKQKALSGLLLCAWHELWSWKTAFALTISRSSGQSAVRILNRRDRNIAGFLIICNLESERIILLMGFISAFLCVDITRYSFLCRQRDRYLIRYFPVPALVEKSRFCAIFLFPLEARKRKIALRCLHP